MAPGTAAGFAATGVRRGWTFADSTGVVAPGFGGIRSKEESTTWIGAEVLGAVDCGVSCAGGT